MEELALHVYAPTGAFSAESEWQGTVRLPSVTTSSARDDSDQLLPHYTQYHLIRDTSFLRQVCPKTRYGPNRPAADMDGNGEFDIW